MLNEIDKLLTALYSRFGLENFIEEIVLRPEAYELLSELGLIHGGEVVFISKAGKVRIINAEARRHR